MLVLALCLGCFATTAIVGCKSGDTTKKTEPTKDTKETKETKETPKP